MNVKVSFFAALKDYFGDEIDVNINEGATVSEALSKLGESNNDALSLLSSCRIAIKDTIIVKEYKLKDQDHIFIIPPSSGG